MIEYRAVVGLVQVARREAYAGLQQLADAFGFNMRARPPGSRSTRILELLIGYLTPKRRRSRRCALILNGKLAALTI
jgi:hypothetical protein